MLLLLENWETMNRLSQSCVIFQYKSIVKTQHHYIWKKMFEQCDYVCIIDHFFTDFSLDVSLNESVEHLVICVSLQVLILDLKQSLPT